MHNLGVSVIILLLGISLTAGIRVDLTKSEGLEQKLDQLKASIKNNEIKALSHEEMEQMKAGTYNLSPTNDVIVDLINYQDLQYYGPLQIGSKNQEFSVVYDTGSEWTWIPKFNCDGCPTNHKFNPITSSSYSNLDIRKELQYGKGKCEGYISRETFNFREEPFTSMKFLLVDIAEDFDGTQADGIAGLTPVSTDGSDLLLEVMVNKGVIDSKQFTVYIGKEGVDDSYIHFGQYQDSTENVTYLPLTPVTSEANQTYWSTDMEEFRYGNDEIKLGATSTVWDTGTSLIAMPKGDVSKFVMYVAGDRPVYTVQDTFYMIPCDNRNEFQDLNFKFGDKTVVVSKYEYLLYDGTYCLFLIQSMGVPEPKYNFVLLGDMFLRGSKIIHDAENMRLGLFPQKRYNYGKDTTSLTWLWILLGCVGVLLIGLGAFCLWRRKNLRHGRGNVYARVQGGSNV